MNHSFDIEHAKEYGIPEAVIIANFQFWIGRNKANGENEREGRTWTYNSVRALEELFPYMTGNAIRRALESLVTQEVLLSGTFNARAADRTKWFAFADEGRFLPVFPHLAKNTNGTGKKAPIHLAENTNGIGKSAKSLITKDITTDITTDISPTELSSDDLFELAWAAYPKRPGASKKDSLKGWNARLKAGADPRTIIEGVRGYAAYVVAKGTEPEFVKQPATFFGPGEHYLADWTPPQAPAAGAQQPGKKFDPSAYVNSGARHVANATPPRTSEQHQPYTIDAQFVERPA
jgi:hypothetical protein